MTVTGPGRFGRHPDYYCFAGMRLTEIPPPRCPAGHDLGHDHVLVGSHPCLCAGTSHRTWRCRACDAIWVVPACTGHPEWPVWRPGAGDSAV